MVESGDRPKAEVRLWDPISGKPMGPWLRNPGFYHPVALSPDGRTMVMIAGTSSGAASSGFRLWDAIAGKPVGEPIPFSGDGYATAFSQDGKTILLGGYDSELKSGRAQLVEAASGKVIIPSLATPGPITSEAFSFYGHTVMAGSRTYFRQAVDVRIWTRSYCREAMTAPPICGMRLPANQSACRSFIVERSTQSLSAKMERSRRPLARIRQLDSGTWPPAYRSAHRCGIREWSTHWHLTRMEGHF